MKIIDLLHKIANGGEVPKKIHIKQFQCDFIFNGHTYLSDEKEQQSIYWCLHSEALNYEVEILEEEKKIPEETTVSEEQILFNKLRYEDQELIIKIMKTLQPCELSCEIEEEKKIPEKFKVHSLGDKDKSGNFVSSPFPTDEEFMNKINDIIDYLDYLKSKGE